MSDNLIEKNENQAITRKKFVLKKRTSIKTDYKVDYENELNKAQL